MEKKKRLVFQYSEFLCPSKPGWTRRRFEIGSCQGTRVLGVGPCWSCGTRRTDDQDVPSTVPLSSRIPIGSSKTSKTAGLGFKTRPKNNLSHDFGKPVMYNGLTYGTADLDSGGESFLRFHGQGKSSEQGRS